MRASMTINLEPLTNEGRVLCDLFGQLQKKMIYLAEKFPKEAPMMRINGSELKIELAIEDLIDLFHEGTKN